jgi:hypothetical protein
MLVMVVSIEIAVVEPLVEGIEMVKRLGIKVRFSGCVGRSRYISHWILAMRQDWLDLKK